MRRVVTLAALITSTASSSLMAQRISDYTTHAGDVPVRLVGYGLVVGLAGTGDRSFGSSTGAVQTVRSVTNLLRRFNIEIPTDRLRLRNVAAVVVSAEISPYLRPGGRFDIQVASLGDATSLRGGVLWITPLTMSPDAPAIASAQGPIALPLDERGRSFGYLKDVASARISEAGLLEMALPPGMALGALLQLKTPDLAAASRIAATINTARGAGTATVQDAGAILLKLPGPGADSLPAFVSSIDTLPVVVPMAPKIVIDARSGTVVAGGDVRVQNAVVTLKGITVRVGDSVVVAPGSTAVPGMINLTSGASVRDIAAGLQALGALPSEVAAVFENLRAAGAIAAAVIVR